MKEIRGNVCSKCEYFTQYYKVKCFHNFEATGFGFCDIKNKIVKCAETCESFCKRKYKKWQTAEESEKAIAVITGLKELM